MLVYSKYNSGIPKDSRNYSIARRIGWIFLIFTSAVLAVLVVVNWLVAHEILRLKKVTIEGTHFITQEEILQLARLDFTKNLLEIEFGEISNRIKQHPFVKDARVKLRLPSGLTIHVLEKEPLAVMRGANLAAIDDFGNRLPKTGAELVHDYPVISNLAPPKGEPWQDSEYGKVVDFLRQMKEDNFALYSEISEISYSPKIGIYFLLTNGTIPVFVGEGGFTQKGANLIKVYRIIENENNLTNIEYFDLRFDHQVVVKERKKRS